MSDVLLINKSTLTDIGDAIREKEGSTALIPTNDMASRIKGISGGDTTVEDALLSGTLTTYNNDKVTKVGELAFQNITTLTSVTLKNATNIEKNAFRLCSKLSTISFPSVTDIGESAFESCEKLVTVSLPKVVTIGTSAFFSIASTTLTLPLCTTLADGVFQYCYNLKTVRIPLITKLPSWTFYYCTALTDIYLGANQVVALANTNCFTSAKTGIKIHVRSAYSSSYKSATNWSSLISKGTVTIVGDYS